MNGIRGLSTFLANAYPEVYLTLESCQKKNKKTKQNYVSDRNTFQSGAGTGCIFLKSKEILMHVVIEVLPNQFQPTPIN